MELSIVIPLYNEEESVEALYQALLSAVKPLGMSYELIFVDDGSSDETLLVTKKIAEQDPNLRVIKFRKNYGQTPAMAAGIDNARGDIIFTMDGDLQNDPADIPLFISKMKEGYDIVVGWRHKRQDKLITRKIPSRIANWLIGKVTGVPIKDNGCSLKAYKADIIQNTPLYSEMHRFIPAMMSLSGVKIAEIKVRHHARKFGESKYGLSRIYKVLFDLLAIKTLVSFLERPLILFGSTALGSLLISGLAFIFAIGLSITKPDTSLIVPLGVSMSFATAGFFMLLCGVLSELVYKTGKIRIKQLSDITTIKEQSHGSKT